ncbi:MAG: AI-2E family transporter, partial [Alphaproteobacteria bacterium]|nr:AI-2E family transporter [Alphaproteobacteria bacterium]
MSEDRAPLQPEVEPPSEHPPTVLQTTINIRSTSLAVLALIAVIGLLYWARGVFIPIAIAVLASYTLTPVVDFLKERARLPKAIGAALTLIAILIGAGFGLESLQPQAIQILDIVPRATEKFSQALRRNALKPPGAVEKIQKAASEIEKAAHAAATTSNTPVTAAATAARAA